MTSITRASRTYDVARGLFVLRQTSTDPFTGEQTHITIGMPIAEARDMALDINKASGGDNREAELSALKREILILENELKAAVDPSSRGMGRDATIRRLARNGADWHALAEATGVTYADVVAILAKGGDS